MKCRNLRGCRLVRSKGGGGIALHLLKTEDSEEECPEWLPTGSREYELRKKLEGQFGAGLFRAIQVCSSEDLDDEREANPEMDVAELEQLRNLTHPSMTRQEREEILTYATDENGEFILDGDGSQVPRRALILRKYATDVLGEKVEEASFWSIKMLIRRILKIEAEQKMIAATKPAAEKENGMPRVVGRTSTEKKSVTVKTGGAKPGPKVGASKAGIKIGGGGAGGSKLAKPLTNKKSKAGAGDTGGEDTQEHSGAISITPEQLREIVASEIASAVAPLRKEIAELSTQIDNLYEQMTKQHTHLHDGMTRQVRLMHTPMVDEDGEIVSDQYQVDDIEDGTLDALGVDIREYDREEEDCESGE